MGGRFDEREQIPHLRGGRSCCRGAVAMGVDKIKRAYIAQRDVRGEGYLLTGRGVNFGLKIYGSGIGGGNSESSPVTKSCYRNYAVYSHLRGEWEA